jgi:asparagine synthase (glutamine-hydrolysing)
LLSPDEQQPVANSQIAVCFDGRLDNREELASKLSGLFTADLANVSDAALVLASYRRFGGNFAAELNGDYALALFDVTNRVLFLARDVMGTRPLYYCEAGQTFVVASEIKAILAHPQVGARPDDDALADRVAGGNPQELRLTCFRDVRRVLPGHTMCISQNAIREYRHWDFDITRQIRCKSIAEYSDDLRVLFEQAVRRRLRSPSMAAVLVSGGIDSSAILSVSTKLKRAGAPVSAVTGVSNTFPDGSPADEKQYLADLEQSCGAQIQRLPFDRFHYVDDEQWLRNVEVPQLFWDAEVARIAAARQLGCASVLDGFCGDQVLSSDAHLYDLIRGFHWLAARRSYLSLSESIAETPRAVLRNALLRRFLREATPDLMMRVIRYYSSLRFSDRRPAWYSQQFRQLAYKRSQQQQRLHRRSASTHASWLYRTLLSAYVVGTLEEWNKFAAVYGLERAYPFLDRDLVQFVMALPGDIVNWRGVYKGLFREAMRGTLPESIRRRFTKADFTSLNNGAASDHQRFAEYLDPATSMAVQLGYLNPAVVGAAFAKQQSRLTDTSRHPAVAINGVIALELWLRAFFGNVRSTESASTAVAGGAR